MTGRIARTSAVLATVLAGTALWCSGCTVDSTGSSADAVTEVGPSVTEQQPMTFTEFFEAYDGAELPGCGIFTLCWYDSATDECTQQRPTDYPQEALDLRIESSDPMKRVWLAMNVPANLTKQPGPDGSETVTYQETYPKSMPPGPASEVGYESRYTLTIEAQNGQVVDFQLYQEDFDPVTKTWGPWFDIRYELDNPIVCR